MSTAPITPGAHHPTPGTTYRLGRWPWSRRRREQWCSCGRALPCPEALGVRGGLGRY